MTIQQSIHSYDHESRRLFLENGQTVKIRKLPAVDADQAVEMIHKLAVAKKLISEDDVIAHFVACPLGRQERTAA